MDNRFNIYEKYKEALPIMVARRLPCDYIKKQIFELEADFGYNNKRIDLDSIWEEESKKVLYSCFITPDEAIIIQTYGRLIESKLEERMNYVRKKKVSERPLKETFREQIEKIEYE